MFSLKGTNIRAYLKLKKKKIFSRENTTTSLFQGTIVFRAEKEPAKWVTNNSYQFEIP